MRLVYALALISLCLFASLAWAESQFYECKESVYDSRKEICVIVFEYDDYGYASATMIVCQKDSETCSKRPIQ